MKVFDYQDYRRFLQGYLESLPGKGYGQLAKIAKALDIHPSLVTLVLQGSKEFTPEQASELSDYLGLSELEAEYLLALVSLARAGKKSLRTRIERRLAKLRAQAESLKDRLPPEAELTEEARALFYAHWYNSAIRILSSVEGIQSAEAIAVRLQLPLAKVKRAVDFLVRHGLCEEKNGRLKVGPRSTHLEASSPLVSRHHANWRQRAISRLDEQKEDELFFTSPVSISRKDIPRVRKIFLQAVEDAFKVIDPSECQEVLCLNVDWFRF